jgi:tRNA pseudouridine32 synthase/23S rRNA pseudouridine746 synthase
MDKHYIALLEGRLHHQAGEIALPFRLDPNNLPYQIYDPLHGKMGISRWRRIGIEGDRSRVEFIPLTGRTHQLRLHASHLLGLGIPIVDDRLYGQGRAPGKLLLHAAYLAFQHPASGQRMIYHSKPFFRGR